MIAAKPRATTRNARRHPRNQGYVETRLVPSPSGAVDPPTVGAGRPEGDKTSDPRMVSSGERFGGPGMPYVPHRRGQ
jgi:hypothetical protein